MKKTASIIVGLILAIAPAVTPVAYAQTVDEQRTIAILQQLIILLTKQLNLLLAQRGLMNPVTEIQAMPAIGAPGVTYTATTTTYAIPLENAPAREAPVVVSQDRVAPQLWEAQFGSDVAAQYAGRAVVRIVASEPVNISGIKFHFRNFPDSFDYVERSVQLSVISENVLRDPEGRCSVNCNRDGYESLFEVVTPLAVSVPSRWSSNGQNNAQNSPEFIVPDSAGNYTSPWQSARDITEFVYE